jgi:hypothetical protein
MIIPGYLLTSMFITMFILYILYPDPEIIVKYPNPNQELSDVYVDDNNVCYRYKRKEINMTSKQEYQ